MSRGSSWTRTGKAYACEPWGGYSPHLEYLNTNKHIIANQSGETVPTELEANTCLQSELGLHHTAAHHHPFCSSRIMPKHRGTEDLIHCKGGKTALQNKGSMGIHNGSLKGLWTWQQGETMIKLWKGEIGWWGMDKPFEYKSNHKIWHLQMEGNCNPKWVIIQWPQSMPSFCINILIVFKKQYRKVPLPIFFNINKPLPIYPTKPSNGLNIRKFSRWLTT